MSSPNLVARLRASPWSSIFARLLAVTAALAVLAWIGRSANANATAQATTSSSAASASPSPSLVPLPVPHSLPPPSSAARGRASPDDPVFLNEADEPELRRLPGVGAKRAEAILSLRKRVGRFHRVEDLMRVKGIGRAAVKKWRPLVRLERPPLPSSPAPDAGGP